VNVVFRSVLGLKCADVSNSFRLYRGDELRGLQLECDNFDIVEEIL
jgi:dolichol-phosphate mannosyltransferase